MAHTTAARLAVQPRRQPRPPNTTPRSCRRQLQDHTEQAAPRSRGSEACAASATLCVQLCPQDSLTTYPREGPRRC